MKKTFFCVFFFIMFMPLLSLAEPQNIVHIKADNIEYYKNQNAYYATGKCLIYNNQYRIKSSHATFFKDTSLAELKDNITIEDKDGNWIRGSKATINLSTYKGFIDDAVMFIKRNSIYIRAKRIIMDSKDKYYIADGTVTGCKCSKFINGKKNAHPKWSFNANHTYVVQNDYIFSYPVVFKARKTPIFFSPFFEKSLTNKRKTGFLLPSIGYSNKDGFKYEQPFFININESQDITLVPFIYTHSGYGLTSKYRFYWTKDSKGSWRVTLFNEKHPYGIAKNSKLRVNLKAEQYANFNQYGNFNYSLNIVNNKDNLRVLNKDNIYISSDRYTTSTASYSIAKGSYSLNINGDFYQDLLADNNRATLQKLPQAIFDITNKKLWKNLTLDFSETAENDFRIEGNRGYSSITNGFLSYPFKLSYFNFVPKIGAHELYAYWNSAPNDKHFSKRSFVPEYSIEAKTSLYGIFLTSNKTGLLGIKHKITPTISYDYIPQRDQSGFPDFISTTTKTNKITFTLENSITAKTYNGNSIKYREILYNKLSQSYDFTKEYHSPFPPIYEETRFSPFEHISFDSKANYSTHKRMFLNSDESLNLNFKTSGASLGYVMSRDSSTYLVNSENAKVKLYMYPIKELYTYVYVEKSLYGNYYPQKKIGFMYNEDCWGLGLDLYSNQVSQEETDGTYTRKQNVGFWITIVLKGLGEIKKQY